MLKGKMIANGTEAEWTYLQSVYVRTWSRWSDFIDELKSKYNWSQHAYLTARTTTEGKRERALYDAQSKASDACQTWLETYAAPRRWSSGVPAHWLYSSLTYADAMTYGQMSVMPPVAYGCTPAHSRAFAMPIPHAEHNRRVDDCDRCTERAESMLRGSMVSQSA